MVIVRIGSSQLPLEQVTAPWVAQQIMRRRAEHANVCVRVEIDVNGAEMTLATPQCTGVGGGRWEPRPLEERIYDWWRLHGLQDADFTPGQVVAFIEQLRRLLD